MELEDEKRRIPTALVFEVVIVLEVSVLELEDERWIPYPQFSDVVIVLEVSVLELEDE